ncbi:hypothetical protein Pcinc_038826 [Petrolisthes cinctipes]|uniref:Uncharacterized protein n=1 Tax=Petrolisthes cinctipes TaxID=88211 RepID=A0AAE1EJJ5_PETCI|nr:hypothetical protein Pcinc_038826 [Petrolisthes cinctipes]
MIRPFFGLHWRLVQIYEVQHPEAISESNNSYFDLISIIQWCHEYYIGAILSTLAALVLVFWWWWSSLRTHHHYHLSLLPYLENNPLKNVLREVSSQTEVPQQSVPHLFTMPQHCVLRSSPPIKMIYWYQLSCPKNFRIWLKVKDPRQSFLNKKQLQKPLLLDQSVNVLVEHEQSELLSQLLWCLRGDPNLPFLLGITKEPPCLVMKD